MIYYIIQHTGFTESISWFSYTARYQTVAEAIEACKKLQSINNTVDHRIQKIETSEIYLDQETSNRHINNSRIPYEIYNLLKT